ncbi:RING-H2 zinc finger protein RHA4a [Morella rubra]|uniref:RING-type E3 ubiquitin transferase n=1 Tax=Morella rubra TaxID=262757 RepID=A0A6A1ULJ0_9ROSI|nr:RING-H2 zinc finger protein RHA4a [Morella rubra]
MGLPETANPSHLSQAVQLKLYQAFIFSIPILFSIILLLLFYLFYLKRRASTLSSPPPILSRSSNIASPYFTSSCQVGLKGDIKDKLPVIVFDEELRTRESQCCVCLGEFEIKEELLQIPSCKHVFHVECIHHWLHSNSTCPLCRCLVLPTKLQNPALSEPLRQDSTTSNQHPRNRSSEQQEQQLQDGGGSNANRVSREQMVIAIEGSSSASICSTDSGRLPDLSICGENEMVHNQGSVVLHIQAP